MGKGQNAREPELASCSTLPADLQALQLLSIGEGQHGEVTGQFCSTCIFKIIGYPTNFKQRNKQTSISICSFTVQISPQLFKFTCRINKTTIYSPAFLVGHRLIQYDLRYQEKLSTLILDIETEKLKSNFLSVPCVATCAMCWELWNVK